MKKVRGVVVVFLFALTLYLAMTPVFDALAGSIKARTEIVTDRWALARVGFREGLERVTTVTGTAVVVASCLWLGVSSVYRGSQVAAKAYHLWKRRPHWVRAYLHKHSKPAKGITDTRAGSLEL